MLVAKRKGQPRVASSTLLAAVIALSAGCGGTSSVEISGEVTANGKPVEMGMILFSPSAASEGLRQVSADISDGKYSVPRAKQMQPGVYSVAITGQRKTGRQITADPGSSELVDEWVDFVPPRYNAKSDLTTTIEQDRSDLNFELSF